MSFPFPLYFLSGKCFVGTVFLHRAQPFFTVPPALYAENASMSIRHGKISGNILLRLIRHSPRRSGFSRREKPFGGHRRLIGRCRNLQSQAEKKGSRSVFSDLPGGWKVRPPMFRRKCLSGLQSMIWRDILMAEISRFPRGPASKPVAPEPAVGIQHPSFEGERS
jgi:hypothetical protein